MRLKYLFGTVVALAVTIALGGCAFMPATHSPDTLGERVTASQNLWRYSGVPFHGDVVWSTNVSLEGRVQNILDRLVYVSPLRGYTIRAGILYSSSANAGTDGNLIFITAGLLQALGSDESLIAAVLAHELGHIIANHTAIREFPEAIILQSALPFLGMTSLGSFAGLAISEGMRMQQRVYSRMDEKEADAIGVILTYEAGYDPYGLSRFFEAKERASGGSSAPGIQPVIPSSFTASGLAESLALSLLRSSPLYRTHPPSPERAAAVDLVARTKLGQIPYHEMAFYDPWLAYVYRVIEARRPKSRLDRDQMISGI